MICNRCGKVAGAYAGQPVNICSCPKWANSKGEITTEPPDWHDKKQSIQTEFEIALKSAVLAEREACAKVCDTVARMIDGTVFPETCAAAIRARVRND